MRPYRLSSHTHACVSAGGAVFLDLKKDEYLGISAGQAHALAGLVEDWELDAAPAPESKGSLAESSCTNAGQMEGGRVAQLATGSENQAHLARELAETLVSRGLLVRTEEVSAPGVHETESRLGPNVDPSRASRDANNRRTLHPNASAARTSPGPDAREVPRANACEVPGPNTYEAQSQSTHRLHLPPGDRELIPWEHMRANAIRIHHVFTFFRALAAALVTLRIRGLERTVNSFQVKRRQRETGATVSFSPDQAQQLVAAYHYIRTWVFARRGRCLLDSLTMLYFLSHYDVWPRWVIGVQMHPFAAHSWIQQDRWLLNATPPFVRAYIPILVV